MNGAYTVLAFQNESSCRSVIAIKRILLKSIEMISGVELWLIKLLHKQ